MSLNNRRNITGPSFEIEADLFYKGHKLIAGVDEAGRGALAGPLSVGIAIFDSQFFFKEISESFNLIKDSKALTPLQRGKALDIIRENALFVSHTFVSPDVIDRINVNQATCLAVRELISLARAACGVDFLLLDGNFRFSLDIPYASVKYGDARSVTIAAASIAAKVARDEYMESIDSEYPDYHFADHKGYGTKVHRDAIERLGGCVEHRKSYDPLKSILGASDD